MKTSDLEALADEALDVAVAHIQAVLGQRDGGFAALWFSGQCEAIVKAILADYARAEIEHLEEV